MASTRAKASQTSTARRGSPRRRKPSRAAIAKRAYELYTAEGGGDQVAHWLQAERELQGA